MKRTLIALFALGSVAQSGAQLELPTPSPAAGVQQTVGITKISIDYSSPGVKGRTIWGSLVPYNELWRTGANASTKITFSTEVEINSTKISAGTYAIFTIPGEKEWVFILNKDYQQSGTANYKQSEDVLRMTVKPENCEFRERMAFQIVDFDENGGKITLEWEKLRISIPFSVATETMAMKSIEKAVGSASATFSRSARHILEHNGDLNKALEYINTADQLSPDSWYITWIKAQILYKKGDKKAALEAAKKAKELGDKTPENFFWKADVEKALVDWK